MIAYMTWPDTEAGTNACYDEGAALADAGAVGTWYCAPGRVAAHGPLRMVLYIDAMPS